MLKHLKAQIVKDDGCLYRANLACDVGTDAGRVTLKRNDVLIKIESLNRDQRAAIFLCRFGLVRQFRYDLVLVTC